MNKKLQKKKFLLTSQLKKGMKLIIPITANLVSVEVIADSSSSSVATDTGKINEVSIQAPIAAANGASSKNTALQEIFL
jgi:hypothetical protein